MCVLVGTVCGTYTLTAGVLQGSGQDLWGSPPKGLPLPLVTEHVKLPLFLLSERVAVTHLAETKQRD